jgi:hypothetical protein
MSERHARNGEAEVRTIKARPLADLRYPARPSPSIPDVLMQEAHKLIDEEANTQAHRFGHS